MSKNEYRVMDVDFSNGIRSEIINDNFNKLEESMDRERVRIGGYGIVEGFELSVNENDPLTIEIGEGRIVNKDGVEISLERQTKKLHDVDIHEVELLTDDVALTVNEDGQIFLPYVPYSEEKMGHFDTDFYNRNYPTEELVITKAGNPSEIIQAVRIDKNVITINALKYANQKVCVKFKHAMNRVDTLLINEKGNIEVAKGTDSDSPSKVDMSKYEGYFLLGLAKVIIDDNVYVELYKDGREYRKVYVDKDNVLYLNGKIYEDKFIYFEEPQNPAENDLWYDSEENKLKVWKFFKGIERWIPVNEVEFMPRTETKIYCPKKFVEEFLEAHPEGLPEIYSDKYPEDKQTFIFGEDEINMRYIPNMNQLEIIIDNAPLMTDQYQEIIEGEGIYEVGIGFRLNKPLDKATPVEVRVNHVAQSAPMQRVFQRTAVFSNESYFVHSSSNTEQIYETEETYIIGESQLEVYIDGQRAIKGYEFEELVGDASASPQDKGKPSKRFKILKTLSPGQFVSYKISKNIYSYDHVNDLINHVDQRSIDTMNSVNEIRSDLNQLEYNFSKKVEEIDSQIVNLALEVGKDQYLRKNEEIPEKNIPQSIKDGLIIGSFTETHPADSVITIENVKLTDFILAFYVSPNINRVMLKDIDYTLQQEDENILMILNNDLVDSSSNVYITGIKFGR